MTENKKPPIYYAALQTLKAYAQANATQYKRRQKQLQEAKKQKQRREQSNEKDTKVSEID